MPQAHRHIGRASQCLFVDDVRQVSGESDSFVLLFVQEALLSEFPQHERLGPAVRRHLDPGQYRSWSAHPHAILKGRLLGGTQPGPSRRGGADCQAVAGQMASGRVRMTCFLLGATVRCPGFAGHTWHLLPQQNCQQPPHCQKCHWLAGMSQDHAEYRVPFLAKAWASALLEEGCPPLEEPRVPA